MTVETEDNRIFKQKFSEMFQRHGKRLFAAASGIIGNREDAEDVLQHVFAKIVRKIVRGEAPADFMKDPEGYMYRSVENKSRDIVKWRHRRKKRHVDVESVEIPGPEIDPDLPARIEHLRVALAKMKPNLAETLHLFYYEERGYREIAKIRGKAVGTVWADLCRARNQVKKLIRIQEKQDEAKKNQRQRISKPGLADASPTGS